jgi:hypothetical protein
MRSAAVNPEQAMVLKGVNKQRTASAGRSPKLHLL